MQLEECFAILHPALRARLDDAGLDSDDLIDAVTWRGDNLMLLAYADLLFPHVVSTPGEVRLSWGAFHLHVREGTSTGLAAAIGRLGEGSCPPEALAGIVAHFWNLSLCLQGIPGRFMSDRDSLGLSYETPGPGPAGSTLSIHAGHGPSLGVMKSAHQRVVTHLRGRLGAPAGEPEALWRELRAREGSLLLLAGYSSLFAPTVALSPEAVGTLFLYSPPPLYLPLHLDLLHAHGPYADDDCLRASGEAISFCWNLQLRAASQDGRFFVDESDGIDVAWAPE